MSLATNLFVYTISLFILLDVFIEQQLGIKRQPLLLCIVLFSSEAQNSSSRPTVGFVCLSS